MTRLRVFFLMTLLLQAESATELLQQKTLAKIRALDAGYDGVFGFFAIDLMTGQTFGYHADTVLPTASSIKIPLLIEVFRQQKEGKFRLSDPITLTAKDAVGGSGVLQYGLTKGPVTLTVRELATAMIRDSDNLATNQLIQLVGRDSVNRLLDDMGFPQTRLQRIMMDSAAAARNEENISTPQDMARILERIYRKQVVDPVSCDEMISLMKLVDAEMRRAIPGSVEVASKPGNLDGVNGETGIVYVPGRPFVVSVMSTYVSDPANVVAPITREVYRYFERVAHANQYGRSLP